MDEKFCHVVVHRDVIVYLFRMTKLDQKYPKSVRLRRAKEFSCCARQGTIFIGQHLTIQFLQSSIYSLKFGITVTKKFGKSHDRNRFKRILRDIFRTHKHLIKKKCWIHVKPTQQKIIVDYQLYLKDFLTAIEQMGVTDEQIIITTT